MFLGGALPLKVWQLLHLSFGTPHRLQGYEPANKRTIVTLIIVHMNNKRTQQMLQTIVQAVILDPFYNLELCFAVKTAIYLGEALLAVIFKVFRVHIDVVSVDAVWLCELGGVLDKLLHLHSRLMFAQIFKGLHRYIGGCNTV